MEKFINFPGDSGLEEKVATLVKERTHLRVKVGKLTAERNRYREVIEEVLGLSISYDDKGNLILQPLDQEE